jgi:dTDP-glucose 4,6-dehydratase
LPPIDIWAGDVCDPHFTAKLVENQEIVFHLAAQIAIPYSYVAPQSFLSVNAQGTLNILESCLRHKVRKLVQTSTSEVYGSALYAPMDESHPLQGQSPYSASKIAADALALSFQRSFGLPVAIARPFNTFGPRQSARAVIPAIISQVLRGQKRIHLGELSPVRDFNYVVDTVSGLIAVAQEPRAIGQAINLGSGRGLSIRRLAEIILHLMSTEAALGLDPRRLRPKESEVYRLVCDNRKAQRLLGWKPRSSLEEGLLATIDYISSHRAQYKADVYNI